MQIKTTMRYHLTPVTMAVIKKSFSSLFAQLPGFSFGFGPASACRSPEGVCSSLTQDGVKGAAASGALAHSGLGERRGTDAG